MATDFPKVQKAVAIDRATAFPLDANAYFESKTAADAAVLAAEEAGNKNTVYYFGQQITVFENNISNVYMIIRVVDQTEKGYHGELKAVGGDYIVDGGEIV